MTLEEIFQAALDKPDAASRDAYLAKACGDAKTRQRVEDLLAAHFRSGAFLQSQDGTELRDGSTLDKTELRAESTDDRTVTFAGDAAPSSKRSEEAESLHFLAPTKRPDSLGRLGHYEVLQVLGKGGFGTVFRAFDDELQRVVAVKVMAPQIAATSPARKRFLREARSSAAVRNENVVQVYEVVEQPLPYLVMEFIPGETLQDKLNRTGPLEVADIVRIGRQVAEGLTAAHATDLIHRDIKPGNILLEGGAGRVKITDFGLARAADDASISQSGLIAGTPMYMAPEQAKGETLDQRADLFSLGSVLYQMAAGRPPFRANSTVAVLKRVAEETPRAIREIIPETPQWLCDIISKLHAKNPEDRYQSAREVADVLADCEAQLKANSKLKDFSRIPRSKQPAAGKSGRWKWVAAAVLLLPLIALAVTEFTGVTHLFRSQVTTDPIKPSGDPTPIAANRMPDTDGWVQLFNGKDLTGWKRHPDQPGNWLVKDGVLIGRGPKISHLFTERSDYRDFHLRLECRADHQKTDSGIYFRCGFDVSRTYPPGYEFSLGHDYDGSLYEAPPTGKLLIRSVRTAETAHEWRTVDIIVVGPRFMAKINGVVVVDFTHPEPAHQFGHIALQLLEPIRSSFVQFRKIEIKELPQLSTFKNSIGMEFVIVPKGKSWLGGGNGKLGDKEVEIPADFYLGKYEVTQEEWQKVMGANPSYFSRAGDGKDVVKDISDADMKRFPVENVSWDQCQIFVAKLNQREKETGWVYRLPTATEWEYACRGGPMADKLDSAFDFYLTKPTNTLLSEQANTQLTGLKRPCKVGSYSPNRLGLFDMHGNVAEWCEESPHATATAKGLRGGCWLDDSRRWGARVGGIFRAVGQMKVLGLRLARVPSPEAKTPSLAVAPFTDADVQRIAAPPAAGQVEEVRKELKRLNPGFDGKIEPTIKKNVVTGLKFNTDEVDNVAPVRALKGLVSLDCSGIKEVKGKLSDLSPLKGMALTSLNISNSKVADLSPLKGMALTSLYLEHTDVTDLSPLKGMPLESLKIYNNLVKDLSPLKGMPLVVFWCNTAPVDDLTPLKDMKLKHLDIRNTAVTDLSPLKGMPLQRLDMGGTKTSDLTPLKGMPLKTLKIYRTQIQDLTPLQGMPLKSLSMYESSVTDLSPLKGMQLEDIRLTPKNITQGLDILRDMKSLKTIGIHYFPEKIWPAAEFWERYDKGEFKE
ncbi:protein kinase domain-containing protein [Urbifossiella limnaea]|uniref:non-specific serine/threonine protein kinase n=1 Tax=Urbifossiella limnaea TaxID=2528023 RepID=A0A517Y1L5_9BACT|nr:protein kinase [Urbifossiella limnaea]QDU23598.1 Serine/threonine-protein kinase PknB [Urbifossiella limnaea]